MAYMNQEKKKQLVALAKPILKKYGVKATFGVDHHSTLVCTIVSSDIDFISNFNNTVNNDYYLQARGYKSVERDYLQVNVYHHRDHFTGTAKEFLTELIDALNSKNHDNSRIEIDYFDVGYYLHVNIGKWNKPYECTK